MPKTVLIIEDEKPMLNVLEEKISEGGFKVLKAENGKDGLDIALKEHPDLILLDLLLPEMSGLNMLEKLRASSSWGQQVPVFVLTNLSENRIIYESVALQTAGYFIKSYWTLEDIATEIKNKLSKAKI